MTLPCRIGITAEERSLPQTLTISLRLELPLESAARSQKLKDTLDYSEIITGIRSLAAGREYVLAESLAEDIAQMALKYEPIQAVEVKVGKKVFSDIGSVGACIYRNRANPNS